MGRSPEHCAFLQAPSVETVWSLPCLAGSSRPQPPRSRGLASTSCLNSQNDVPAPSGCPQLRHFEVHRPRFADPYHVSFVRSFTGIQTSIRPVPVVGLNSLL